MIRHIHINATISWLSILENIIDHGKYISPRGQETLEILHNSSSFNMEYPIVLFPDRKLNYSFMAAEAIWILANTFSVLW